MFDCVDCIHNKWKGKEDKSCCEYDLQEVDIGCNKVNGVECLIFKHEGKVFDVVVL